MQTTIGLRNHLTYHFVSGEGARLVREQVGDSTHLLGDGGVPDDGLGDGVVPLDHPGVHQLANVKIYSQTENVESIDWVTYLFISYICLKSAA